MRRLLVGIAAVFPLQAAAVDQEPSVPGLDLLEYLGEWRQSDDEWVDPVGLYASGLLGSPPDRPKTPDRKRPMNRNQDPR